MAEAKGSTRHQPPWDVLLLGGASGTGKSSVASLLADHFWVSVTEVDDLYVVLETMTSPEQQPVLHHWHTHPEARQMAPAAIVELSVSVAETMAPAIEAVIANHLEERSPVVIEGDYLLPATAARSDFLGFDNGGRVRGVFLFEADDSQIEANYLRREPDAGSQGTRARVSRLYGEWLRGEADRHGVPVVDTRPWETLFERVLSAVIPESGPGQATEGST